MSQSLKEGNVTKEVASIKENEARDLGIQDFFVARDKNKRGSEGLINDSNNILGEELKVKQELYDKSQGVSSLPKHIVPLFTGVFLTAKRNKLQENGIYLPTASFGKGSETDMDQDFSEVQNVLACGPHAKQLAPGWEVVINMDNFKKRLESSMAQKVNKEYEYVLPIEVIDGVEYMYMTERDIKYVSNTNGIKLETDEPKN